MGRHKTKKLTKNTKKQPQSDNDALTVSLLNNYMENPENFDAVLGYFYLLLDEGKKEILCQFLSILMADYKSDTRVIQLINDIVYILVKNHYPVAHELKFTFNEHHQDALETIFKNTEYIPKDLVIMGFDHLIYASLAYYLRMFIWDFCPNYRLQIAVKLFSEFDEYFVFTRGKQELFDYYVPCLVGVMIPFLVVARRSEIKVNDKVVDRFLYSDVFVRNVLRTVSLVFRGYIVPTTMKKFMQFCHHNTDKGLHTDSLTQNQEYLADFNRMATSILLIVKNLDLNLISDELIGMCADENSPYPAMNGVEHMSSNFVGADVTTVTNQLLFFLSFFRHIFNYYHSVGSNSNDVIFSVNYDMVIKNFMSITFQMIETGNNNNNNYNSSMAMQLKMAENGITPITRATEANIHWVDYLLFVAMKNPSLEKQLVLYLMECRPNHTELFLLFLQTDCITNKHVTENVTMMEMFEQNDMCASIIKSTAARLMRISVYFAENNTAMFVKSLAEIFQRLSQCDYLNGPAAETVWCMTSAEATRIDSVNTAKGIRTLQLNRFRWIKTNQDTLRHTVSALLAYILKQQTEYGFLDPFLIGLMLVAAQHFRQYHFLVAYVCHWHIAVFPDLYLRLYKGSLMPYIRNMYLIEKILSIFHTQLTNNCTYTPCEFLYGSEIKSGLNTCRMSLAEYQYNLTEVCLLLPKQPNSVLEDIKLMCDFIELNKTKIIQVLNSFKDRLSQTTIIGFVDLTNINNSFL